MTFDLFGDVSTCDDGMRSEFDFYETTGWMTGSLIQHTRTQISGCRVLEPCSGRNAIARLLKKYAGCRVFTNDIDTRHEMAETHFDATQPSYWRNHAPEVDWVISNTPFDVAFPIVRQAYDHARMGVMFLLRKTWLEPTDERGPWLASHPPTRQIGLPRASFRGKGSDMCACDWMIWERRPDRSLPPIVIDYAAETRRLW